MEKAEILICEDERLVALELESRLESYGHRVRGIAARGEDAIRLARELRPTLALMDVRLEGDMTGVEVAEVIGPELGIPVIYLTAYADRETVEKAKNTFALGYLLKPVKDRDLEMAVEMGLAISRREKNTEAQLERLGTFFSSSGEKGMVPFHENLTQYLEAQARREVVTVISGGMAHHLNNYLSVIRAHLEWLSSLPTVGDFERRQLSSALDSCSRSSDLVQQLVWSSGRGGYQLRILPVQSVLLEALGEMRSTLPSNIETVTSIYSESYSVFCDRAALKEAFKALIKNAAESMPHGGTISVRCATEFKEVPEPNNPRSKPGWYAVVQIEDTGEGMEQEAVNRVFDPFYSTRNYRDAFGLGLSVVYGVAENLSGWLEIDTAPGRGSTFSLFVPRVADTQSVEAALPGASERREADVPITLVIDDEPAIGDVLRMLLVEQGLKPKVFTDPIEGVAWYEKHHDDVGAVLLDVKMPKLDGFACLKRIRAVAPHQEVALMTGAALEREKLEGDGAAVSTIIHKPFSITEILKWLDRAGAPKKRQSESPSVRATRGDTSESEPPPQSDAEARKFGWL